MSKSNRLYKLFMTSMIVIIAGLLLATGIIAIQKHLNLKMGVVFQPGVNVEIGVMNMENFATTYQMEEVLILRNFDDGADKHVEVNQAVLQGSKLTLTEEFINTYALSQELLDLFGLAGLEEEGRSVIALYINNYTPEVVEVSLDLSHGEVGGSEFIAPYYETSGASQYGSFVAIDTASVILPNTKITLDIQLNVIEQQNALLTGQVFNTTLKQINNSSATYESEDTSITSITFGDYATCDAELSGVTGIDVSHAGDGSIKAYALDTNSDNTKETVYVLSENNIYANVFSNYMFCDFANLTQVTFGNFNTSNVTDMRVMFSSCSNLTSLDLSSFDTSKVTDMAWMFNGCSSLESLDVSSFNTSNVTDMVSMFSYCSKLTSLDLSSFDTSNVTDMLQMFLGCSNLTTIYVGSKWSTTSVTSSSYMFTNCKKLVGAIAYDSTKVDKTHANYTTGYLTYKAATS